MIDAGCVACRNGDGKQVRKLLPNYSHIDLNRQEYPYGGNTCLHIAAANGRDNIVKLLLQKGCYRSALLNSQNQSAYDLAASNKESTRLLSLRQDENDPSLKSSSRFYEQNASECFDIVRVDSKEDDHMKNPTIQTYKTEQEKRHAIGYSASSKAMCQSRFGRRCVNTLHLDEPLNRRVYRGMNMTYEQLLIYQIAMDTPGTVLQTRAFSSTSMDRSIAEGFAHVKRETTERKDLSVLFIFDFPNACDQAINLSRISSDTPCLSEYEDEKEVLILPWTLFEVTNVTKSTDEDD